MKLVSSGVVRDECTDVNTEGANPNNGPWVRARIPVDRLVK